MNKKYLFMALVGATALLTSCSDDIITEETGFEKHIGDEIQFGGNAGFFTNDLDGNAKTRTIYTDDTTTIKGYEGIQWQANDKVRVYCPQAAFPSNHTSDYIVNTNATGVVAGAEITGLTRLSSEGSLQWGNPNEKHDFYAVYPSPAQTLHTSINSEEVIENKTTLIGYVPSVQSRKSGDYAETSTENFNGLKTVSGTRYIVKPNMDYAYMVARTSINKPNSVGENIYLHFHPVVTALEVTITNLALRDGQTVDDTNFGQPLSLANVLVSSKDNSPIYGAFSYDLAKIKDKDKNGYGDSITADDIVLDQSKPYGTTISIPLQKGTDGLYGDPLTLNHGDAVTFTVFILPTVELNSIAITVQGTTGSRTATINNIDIKATKKNFMKNLPLAGGNILPFTQEEWLKYVDNSVLLKNLSIPGAGGAASGNVLGTGLTLGDTDREQDLSIEDLWNTGIRCFEFATDCTTDEDLGQQPVICNGQPCGITLETAINKVIEQLSIHDKEFAMVILTYQCTGGWGARTPATWVDKLNAYWPTVGKALNQLNSNCELAIYDPSNEMIDARGKLFCIARPTSINQDYSVPFNGTNYGILAGQSNPSFWQSLFGQGVKVELSTSTTTVAHKEPVDGIVIIDGWGPLKDKWQQRGYSYQSVRHITTGKDGRIGRPFDVASLYDHAKKTSFADWVGQHPTLVNKAIEWNGKTWYGDFPYVNDYNIDKAADNNFTYPTSLGTGKSAWVQEWARVSNFIQSAEGVLTISTASCHNGKEARVVFWDSSLDEKKYDIKEALNLSINKAAEGCAIYINSLCGYFIDENIPASVYPCALTDYNSDKEQTLSTSSATAGLQGNIGEFANHINKFFKDYLDGTIEGYTPGSMGIILMDRISKNEGDASHEIASYIVNNNFKHDTGTQAATLSEIKKTETAFDPNNEAPLAKPRNSEGGMTITWE